MKNYLIPVLLLAQSFLCFSQNPLKVEIEGLVAGDSARIIIQKEGVALIKKTVHSIAPLNNKIDLDLADGKWVISIDAAGYAYPPAKSLVLPQVNYAKYTLNHLPDGEYKYLWADDDSYAGHATQTYINEENKLIIVDDTIQVPTDYSAIKLRNEFGIILSNEISPWSSEDSYRLYKSLKTIPEHIFVERSMTTESGQKVESVFRLSPNEIFKDIEVEIKNNVRYVTVSQSAFTYASPTIVKLNNIKGNYFSKRLHNALVNYVTDFGQNTANINIIASEIYGVRFMESVQETEDLMGEDQSNFQSFTSEEKIQILTMLEEFPSGLHKQEGLAYFVRRVNGQVNPTYPAAPAIAWTTLRVIEFMSIAFNNGIEENVRRLIIHEKAHFLWAYTYNKNLIDDWVEIGGWFKDPTSLSGWTTCNTTEFVTPYSYYVNPDEDMAESISYYLTNPDALKAVSMRKYEFIRDRVMSGAQYIAQIREDLTFTVYNLFPDYTYPGKIVGVDISVVGESYEDKVVSFEFKLKTEDLAYDGASIGYIRMQTTSGHIQDLWLYPKNGTIDSILVGTTTFSKHLKSGYWNLQFIRVDDPSHNSRYENTASIGFKLFINNPLEDINSPVWRSDFKMEKIPNFDLNTNGPTADTTNAIQAIKYSYSFFDNSPMLRSITRVFFPSLDSTTHIPYELQIQGGPIDNYADTTVSYYNSDKHFEMYLPIPEYYPSGYYSVSSINTVDIADNWSNVYFSNDTSDVHVSASKGMFKDVRDSIYIRTKHPDYIAPIVDVNRIHIAATPTNPTSPDGETKVDISLLVKDVSDHIGFESGTKEITYILRDPQGKEFSFNSWNENGLLDWYTLKGDYTNAWKLINFHVILPKGSFPGKWGLVGLKTLDRANNFRNYSFVEILHFEIIESDLKLIKPLKAEIVGKRVNASNVENISANISCYPGKGLNYNLTIYSLMGGSIVRRDGFMTDDSIHLDAINVKGVLDGIIIMTVQMTDSLDRLVATTSVEYTKDTERPKSFYSRCNLWDLGTSSIDYLIIQLFVDSMDVGGDYRYEMMQLTRESNVAALRSASVVSKASIVSRVDNLQDLSRVFTGKINNTEPVSINPNFSLMSDGYFRTVLEVSDSCGNVGEPYYDYYYKKDGMITYIGTSMPANEVHTDSAEVFTGKTVLFPINISYINLLDSVSAYQFKLVYDSTKLEYLGYSKDNTLSQNGTVELNQRNNGEVRIGYIGNEYLSGEGLVLNLRFKALHAGETTPVISEFLLNTDSVDADSNGTLLILTMYGDVDGNEHIQAYDAALVLQNSVGLDPMPSIDPIPWTSWRVVASDVDGNDNLTANDAGLILRRSIDLMSVFPVETMGILLRSATTNEADVTITRENNSLVFRSIGNLIGLNVSLVDNFGSLGSPQILNENMMRATNINARTYRIGLATATSPTEGSTFMIIPIMDASAKEVTLNLFVNDTVKVIRANIATNVVSVLEMGIKVYPNPVRDNLTIEFGVHKDCTVRVTNLLGQTVYSSQANNQTLHINMSEFASTGLFHLQIFDAQNKVLLTKKLLKQ